MSQRTFQVGDFVECSRVGFGSFEVIEARGTGSHRELRLLQHVDSKTVTSIWIYEAHCSTNLELSRKSLQTRRAAADAIGTNLSRPRRKR